MRRAMARSLCVAVVLAATVVLPAQSGQLAIYWIDVEGGAATLIVTPAGQSLLIDTGNATPDDRDAKRIHEAALQAGLKKIDLLVTTHFHGDHVGGAAALAKLMPIERFFDHGDSIETQNPQDAERWESYKALSAGKRTIVKPGGRIPLRGAEAVVVSSNGAVLARPINGGGPNPLCQGAARKDPDATENARSVGVLVTYGKFTFLDLGDLTWNTEMDLACPENKVGAVSLFQATHHGFYRDNSGAPAHVMALRPRVVVVNNGPHKGLHAGAWETIQKIPRLEGVWQVHLSLDADKNHNTGDEMIANPEPTNECKGKSLKASVAPSGAFTLTNSRNAFSKTYAAR